MRAKIIGFKNTQFTSKDTGEVIKGKTVYVTYPDDKVEGEASERVYIKNEVAEYLDLVVGATIRIFYNKYGKVDDAEVVYED